MCTYTKNAARAIEEEDEYGTLEEGKAADFFVADRDFFTLTPEEIADFRPEKTFYGGHPAKRHNGSILELLIMLLSKPKKI